MILVALILFIVVVFLPQIEKKTEIITLEEK
jgi:hypothetical protein